MKVVSGNLGLDHESTVTPILVTNVLVLPCPTMPSLFRVDFQTAPHHRVLLVWTRKSYDPVATRVTVSLPHPRRKAGFL
jgi:hypothetical protein